MNKQKEILNWLIKLLFLATLFMFAFLSFVDFLEWKEEKQKRNNCYKWQELNREYPSLKLKKEVLDMCNKLKIIIKE